MTMEKAIEMVLAYFEENESDFIAAIEELDSRNGYLGDDRYYSMDDFDELLSDYSPWGIANMIAGNDFSTNHNYFKFTPYGITSSYEPDYSDYLDECFAEEYIENINNIYDVPAEIQDILDSKAA